MTQMTYPEWLELAGLIDAWWPATEFSEDSEQAYFPELQRFSRDEVEAAIRAHLLVDTPFGPALAQLLVKLDTPQEDLPTWQHAWNRITWAIRRHPGDEAAGLALLGREHATIADFAATYGWQALGQEPVDDPQHGGAVMHRLEARWSEHIARWKTRQRAGAVRSQMQVASARRAGELRRPDVRSLAAGRVDDSQSDVVEGG